MAVRVGFVIGQLTVGGAEGQLYELLRHLDARFVPTVYCLAGSVGGISEDLARIGVTVRIVGSSGLRRARRLASLIRVDNIDLVHSWLFIANGYAAAATAGGRLRPLITSARNCKVQGRASQLVNRLGFRCSRAIVVNSGDVEDYIVANYAAPRARIEVIFNGIDTQRFRPCLPVRAPDPPLIVNIGRLVQQKNQGLFLEAARQVVQLVPEARFMIVGDGPLRAELEAQATAMGLDGRVSFAGERRDTEEILRQASLFWLTSRWEGMPNVVLEALASGVPTIATDVGGTRELVRNGVEGFIVPSGETSGFVAHSVELLHSSDVWCRFAEAARCRAEEFSPRAMSNKIEQLYDRVLSGPYHE